MSDKKFGERSRAETDPRFGDYLPCPECGKTGREHALRNHLRNTHDWDQDGIEDRYGGSPIPAIV